MHKKRLSLCSRKKVADDFLVCRCGIISCIAVETRLIASTLYMLIKPLSLVFNHSSVNSFSKLNEWPLCFKFILQLVLTNYGFNSTTKTATFLELWGPKCNILIVFHLLFHIPNYPMLLLNRSNMLNLINSLVHNLLVLSYFWNLKA